MIIKIKVVFLSLIDQKEKKTILKCDPFSGSEVISLKSLKRVERKRESKLIY